MCQPINQIKRSNTLVHRLISQREVCIVIFPHGGTMGSWATNQHCYSKATAFTPTDSVDKFRPLKRRYGGQRFSSQNIEPSKTTVHFAVKPCKTMPRCHVCLYCQIGSNNLSTHTHHTTHTQRHTHTHWHTPQRHHSKDSPGAVHNQQSLSETHSTHRRRPDGVLRAELPGISVWAHICSKTFAYINI